MRITTSDGVGLEVEVAGAGPGLVLVHGLGGAKEDFADHVPVLARDHTVVVFDHRGHGASDKPAERSAYSIDRLAADVVEVVDAVGLERFRLLGHSMGGMVARRIPMQASGRVEALVMMDTSAGPIPGFDPDLMAMGAEVAFSQGKDALKELLDLAQTLETPAYQRVLQQRPGYQEFQDRKWSDLSEIMWGSMILELANQLDEHAALAQVATFPVLALAGAQDDPFVTAAHALVAAVPHAQLAIIPEAGHSPQFENPQAWIDALTGFLASVPAPVDSSPVK